jgi:hypothetical protein
MELTMQPTPNPAPTTAASPTTASPTTAGPRNAAAAALLALLVLDLAMFASMLAGVQPHPPGARGPFIAATAALAGATLWQLAAAQRAAVPLLVLSALAFVPAVGPQKFLTEPAALDLAPVIVVGTGAVVALLVAAWRLHGALRLGVGLHAPQAHARRAAGPAARGVGTTDGGLVA